MLGQIVCIGHLFTPALVCIGLGIIELRYPELAWRWQEQASMRKDGIIATRTERWDTLRSRNGKQLLIVGIGLLVVAVILLLKGNFI